MGFSLRRNSSLLIRNITFGVEDGLVSTVGFLSGVAAAAVPRGTIFVTGFVLILVEAFSMGIGSLLSEHSAEESAAHHEVPLTKSSLAALAMFVSYFVSGLIPLLPYSLFPVYAALPISVMLTLLSVLFLGLYNARHSGVSPMRKTFEMLILSGLAIAFGLAIGRLLT